MTDIQPAQVPRGPKRTVDGILLLDKPSGQTSNRVLQRVKRLYQARKAGHTGSLDPLASGMLPICLGQATKLSGYLLEASKTYTVTADWGTRTATADAEGEVLETCARTDVDRARLVEVLQQFQGEILQVPPMYSALKHQGQRLYKLARAGQHVERPARRVVIHSLELVEFHPSRPVLKVHCSKGTYIRTLVEDVAAACGTLGHVIALRRDAVEPFDESAMVRLDDLEACDGDLRTLDAYLRPVDMAIADWDALELGADQAFYLSRGHAVTAARAVGRLPGRVRLYGPERRFLGIGEILGDGRVAPRRMFV
jgi:tRNA pseudouridine55 synthase